MPLSIARSGVLSMMNTLTRGWGDTNRIGLFQNDYTPTALTTIGELVPCDFDGYDLHWIMGWLPATLEGLKAVAIASDRLWVKETGSVGNWVFGLYALDRDGNLLWAERFSDAPFRMNEPGDYIRFAPKFSFASQY